MKRRPVLEHLLVILVTGGPGILSRHKLAFGSALYVLTALADIKMTLAGMGGDIELEGNPVMRAVMAHFGPETGLLLEKALVGAICFVIAKYGEREIKRGADWIWKLPSTNPPSGQEPG